MSINNQGDEQLFVMQHMANPMIGGELDNMYGTWILELQTT